MEYTLGDESPVTHLTHKLQCSHCGKMEQHIKGKLKRCAGCTIARYCSRECQKNAWPTHKEFCRRPSTTAQSDPAPNTYFAGFPTAISLADAIREWVRIHDYGFTVITESTVLLNGGVNHAFATSHALRFVLDLGPNNKGDGNPATVFKLIHKSLETKASFLRQPDLTDEEDWSKREQACRLEAVRKRLEVPHVTVAGVLPAAFMVHNTGLVAWHRFPIFTPRSNLTPLLPPLQFLLEDLVEISTVAMNAGDILRLPKVHVGRPDPEVGNLIRKNGQWKWKFKDEEAFWDALDAKAVEGFSRRVSVYPRELWKYFHSM
ncbi:hypothetical protein FKP32DRAFT_1598804 [Trametes sanguinea]|nr:hypothetical protein FKP32DRAFT_1598804 [Trametes sanguinea]